MIPRLTEQDSVQQIYLDYLEALQQTPFSGDIETSYGSRLVMSTDNSIYQQIPQAIVYPKTVDDLQCIGHISAEQKFTEVKFSARGGGTGTNGQSLTSGIVVDMSRHMNQLLEINEKEGWARVQSGLVKDQLNEALKPFGYFFSPDLSTSNRATIGGMINTDASGQGSMVYGKTSDHVLALRCVLANGELLDTEQMSISAAESLANAKHAISAIYQQAIETCRDKRQQILSKFPRLNRFLTGYDLEHVFNDDLSQFDLGRLIAGSEGSLAFIAEAKIKLTPIPTYKVLLNVKYDSFESALRNAPVMLQAKATSVETIDSKVLNLAKTDIIWHSVSEHIQDVEDSVLEGLNIVEYNSDDKDDIEVKLTHITELLDVHIAEKTAGIIGYQVTRNLTDIQQIYAMRKKAVGLLGKSKGWKKPQAFAEDTAVPPERLADFIMEFRALLDGHNLEYGMFGHVDAGVLHVRPALDLIDPEQEKMLRTISDQVVALVAKYGGLMWGEHGKGYRSEYSQAFFGEELFTELRKIKTAFDPHNKMNPGKICTPLDSSEQLVSVDGQKRAFFDRQIPLSTRDSFETTLSCNGNGLCFNYDTKSPMCPSMKVSQDRRHSPKGRAGLMREWLRQLASNDANIEQLERDFKPASVFTRLNNSLGTDYDYSHEVMDAMNGCLACKACSNQCPINVDVPTFRSRFLQLYYGRYLRPMKDYLVATVEKTSPVMASMAGVVNPILKLGLVKALMKKTLGYTDMPTLSQPTLKAQLRRDDLTVVNDLTMLGNLDDVTKARSVLIVQDTFTSFYDAEVVADTAKMLRKLGFNPLILPFKANGKPQHVKGFLQRFKITATETANYLARVAKFGIPMIGIDASMTLAYRDEYSKTLGDKRGDFQVQLIQEWLVDNLPDAFKNKLSGKTTVYSLFAHCTEKTAQPLAEQFWQQIYYHLGLTLNIVRVGCCGMAGTYGHETEHLENSLGIYQLSWKQAVSDFEKSQVLVTGYSCRSQVKRIEQFSPLHPSQVLLELLS